MRRGTASPEAPAQGASFEALGGGAWRVTSADGAVVEVITFQGNPAIHGSDYLFA